MTSIGFKEWYFEEYNYKISNDDTLENLVEYIRKFMDSMTTDNDILKTYFDYNKYVSDLIRCDDYEVYRLVSNGRFLKYEESFHDISYNYDSDNFNSNSIICHEKCIIFKKVEESVKILQTRIQQYEDQVKSLKEIIANRNKIIAKYEDKIANKEGAFPEYKSDKYGYEGYIQYFEDRECYGLYIKYCKGRNNIYKYVRVYGSWDNYERGYDLYQLLQDEGDTLSKCNCSVYFIVLDESIPYGKYTYKFKKDDQWIEPREDELREKDKDGNYNNILFVHD